MLEPIRSRRRFLIGAACATLSLPFATGLIGTARAAELPPLPLDNPQAKALGYTADGSATKNANFKPGSACSNCQLFTAATGACSLFSGYRVSPKGWCSAWSKKAG